MSAHSQSHVDSEELFNTEELMHESESHTNNINTDETQIPETEILQENIETPDLDLDLETPEVIQQIENELETEDGLDIAEQDDDENLDTIDEEHADTVEQTNATKKKTVSTQNRMSLLPFAKIKHIIKLDPDVNLVNAEAVFLITKTTEMFIRSLAKESYVFATQNKKKTLAKNHVEQALTMLPVEL